MFATTAELVVLVSMLAVLIQKRSRAEQRHGRPLRVRH
jgi:hypothetical protein